MFFSIYNYRLQFLKTIFKFIEPKITDKEREDIGTLSFTRVN